MKIYRENDLSDVWKINEKKEPVMIEKIKEKFHIIVVVIITIYLIALAAKTAHVIYTEHIKEGSGTIVEGVAE